MFTLSSCATEDRPEIGQTVEPRWRYRCRMCCVTHASNSSNSKGLYRQVRARQEEINQRQVEPIGLERRQRIGATAASCTT
jgi:hypothetical protein